MKQAAMLLVIVAAISWSVAPAVERAPESPPTAAAQILHTPMVGWAISRWDRHLGRPAGAMIATITAMRCVRDGFRIGGLLGGIVGGVVGGALGGL